MKKIILLIGIIVLLVSSCSTKQKIYEDCMIGCFAGINYNGSDFLMYDENIDEEKLEGFIACENLCKFYEKNK